MILLFPFFFIYYSRFYPAIQSLGSNLGTSANETGIYDFFEKNYNRKTNRVNRVAG